MIEIRLADNEIRAIEQAASQIFPVGTQIKAFGSRLDLDRLGVDIDLLVVLPQPVQASQKVAWRNELIALLYCKLGEQKIDVILTDTKTPDDRPVVKKALAVGKILVTI